MCESKGTNEPPNSATAAGYYQITEETWREAREHGVGSLPDDASKHSKTEQGEVARYLWAGGAGAGRWECKA